MNEQLMESISLAIKRAFDSGRKYENQLIWEAVDWCSTGNEHGDFVYLDDLKEHIDELNEKRKAEKIEH
jgi:hypothetical protein